MKKVNLPDKFKGLFRPYRFKIFYGGRGGAKSRSFASALLLLAAKGHERVLCAREVQNSIKDSVKRLLDDEIDRLGLGHLFVSTDSEIRCPSTNSVFIFSGLRLNPERIKSFEGITRVWIEEAETISERSWNMLVPTIRMDGSEVWCSFNPDRINGVLYQMFVINQPPPRSLVVKVGWRDNPWFPDVLREEMEHCKEHDPDKYMHVWEGEPVKVAKGSYYGRLLAKAQDSQRITHVPCDPALLVHTAWDLGVGDSTSIWFFQHLATGPTGEFRIIDYYECSGEGLAHYASVLESKGYEYGRHIAPHDIKVRELGTGKSRLEKARSLGIRFDVAPKLPVQDGIDAVRGVIASAWFDQDKCEQGLSCLWSYQREYDEINACFKEKPLHDWTSHGADAFRYLATGFRPLERRTRSQPQRYYAGGLT